MGRVLILGLLMGWVGATWAIRRRRLLAAQRVADGEQLPARLRDGTSSRTWVLVTSPLCATCGLVEQRLRELDPDATIVSVDAAAEPGLARALQARAAPTLILADPEGRVRHRLAGPRAVTRHLDDTAAGSNRESFQPDPRRGSPTDGMVRYEHP